MDTNSLLHVNQVFDVLKFIVHHENLFTALENNKTLVCTCEHTKKNDFNGKKCIKSQDIGVQGCAHHILWCAWVAYTSKTSFVYSESAHLKFWPYWCTSYYTPNLLVYTMVCTKLHWYISNKDFFSHSLYPFLIPMNWNIGVHVGFPDYFIWPI
jgi:hypothetical protein